MGVRRRREVRKGSREEERKPNFNCKGNKNHISIKLYIKIIKHIIIEEEAVPFLSVKCNREVLEVSRL